MILIELLIWGVVIATMICRKIHSRRNPILSATFVKKILIFILVVHCKKISSFSYFKSFNNGHLKIYPLPVHLNKPFPDS